MNTKVIVVAGNCLDFFEKLNRKQSRLWNNKDDIGIVLDNVPNWTSEKGMSTLKEVARDSLKELMDNYAYKLERAADRRSSVTSIFIPFKFDDEIGRYVGVDLHVTYLRGYRHFEYLSISIKRAIKSHAQANADGPLFKMPETEYIGENDQEPMDRDYDESCYLAELSRSNPGAWAEAAYDATKRF